MAQTSLVKAFHALSDPLRIQIIETLRHQECCVQDLCEKLEIGQSKISFHLRVLKESEILRSRPQGRWMYYSLNLVQIVALEQQLADYRCDVFSEQSVPQKQVSG
ncbi:MAG: metalloregulator ArsR/SmtB family transcription factor [Cyanobacteria bacterium P01_H01_bin.58]